MFLHEEIGLLSYSAQLRFLCLLNCVCLMIDFGDCSENGGEIAGANVLYLMEFVHA